MIQTVIMAQQLFAKAALVDHQQLAAAQNALDLVRAESCLQDAFATDVRLAIRDWRISKNMPADPMDAFRQSGYLERVTVERGARGLAQVSRYA
jgi:L-rhamnose isomerase/sugar isomerase